MRAPFRSAVALLAFGQLGSTFKVSIIADHNRDGQADCKDSKVANRCSFDAPEALFLPAITDTDRRCSKKITRETSDDVLDQCHDGTDNILRHPERLAPVFTKPIKRLSKDATGTISVVCDTKKWKECDQKVRIFQDVDGEWTYITPEDHTFSASELKSGLKLGIDGRDVRRPNVWDGRVKLEFQVKDSQKGKEATDCVAMRVSPLLTHHHLQDADKVFSYAQAREGDAPAVQTVKEIVEAVQAVGFEDPVYHFSNYDDKWVQDFFEAAYTSIPGPKGEAISIRVMIRSSVSWNEAGRAAFEELRDGDVGAVQDFQNEAEDGNIDGTGNLETIPPYTSGDATYPNGRIIMGMFLDDKPAVLGLLESQEMQDPIVLDNNWLEVGHVDEYFQFLPADSPRGWVLMAADPSLAISMLQELEAEGKGDTPALSRLPQPTDYEYSIQPNHTVSEVLGMELMIETNEFAHERIEYNIGILKKETGLTDEEILKIPSIYWTDTWISDGWGDPIEDDDDDESWDGEDEGFGGKKMSKKRQPKSKRKPRRAKFTQRAQRPQDPEVAPRPDGMEYGLSSFYPATINGLVLPGGVVTGNPWGPVIDGVDILAKAVEKSYGKIGVNVTFVDDWESLRAGQGGVHCATNAWRDMGDAKWW